MKFKKDILKYILMIISFFLIGCQQLQPDSNADQSNIEKDDTAEFNLYASVYDDGQKIDKIEIKMPYSIKYEDLSLDSFSVSTENTLSEKSTEQIEIENGERIIKDIFLKGHENEGDTIILKLNSDFGVPYAGTLVWDDDNFTNIPLDIKYKITQNKEINNKKIKDYKQKDLIDDEVDLFTEGESETGIKYRDYKPKDTTKKHPLVIWFHGAGEGKGNNISHITANKGGVAFVTKEAQMILGEPYVLAPQSPDFWMPEFEVGDRVLKGKDRTEELIALISQYIKDNSIDEKRVYVGGASMGGYQTWEIIARNPEMFAAAFPIASAYEVPKGNLDKLTNVPIWITHAKKDETVPYTNSSEAYDYLKEFNEQVYFSLYENVKIGNEDFDDHASWVYTLNNEPQIEELKIFEWLAQQKND